MIEDAHGSTEARALSVTRHAYWHLYISIYFRYVISIVSFMLFARTEFTDIYYLEVLLHRIFYGKELF